MHSPRHTCKASYGSPVQDSLVSPAHITPSIAMIVTVRIRLGGQSTTRAACAE